MDSDLKLGYREIKNIILDRLKDKTWPPGAIVPNEVDLAQEFRCTRTTVNRAMRELAEEGILIRKRKAGTKVATRPIRQAKFSIPSIRAEIEATGAKYHYELITRDICAAPSWLQIQMSLINEDRLLHMKSMHYGDGKPFQHEERWINLSLIPEAETISFQVINPNEWLIQKVPLTTGHLAFMAAKADCSLAGFLNIAEHDPIFVIERMTWLNDAVVTFARMHFPSGYRMETGF